MLGSIIATNTPRLSSYLSTVKFRISKTFEDEREENLCSSFRNVTSAALNLSALHREDGAFRLMYGYASIALVKKENLVIEAFGSECGVH